MILPPGIALRTMTAAIRAAAPERPISLPRERFGSMAGAGSGSANVDHDAALRTVTRRTKGIDVSISTSET